MAVIVVAHGAWSGGWSWRKMRPLWRAAGHEVLTPTCTGLGERAHLVRPEVDLATHVADIVGVLDAEDLREVVLLAHSYGGMVATGVAQQRPERLRRIVYLDALVPRPGEAVFDILPAAAAARMRAAVAAGDGWRIPPNPLPPDTPPEWAAFAAPRRLPQPVRTFEQRLPESPLPDLPRAYLFCTRVGPDDTFRPFAERVRREPGWSYAEIDATHNPHVTVPERLAALVEPLLAGG